MSKVCGCGFKESCYMHCDHTDPRCPGEAYDMLVSNPESTTKATSNVPSEPPINTIETQYLRDIFNENGANYSQVVGDELTVVSMKLQDFNWALTQIHTLITQARIAEREKFIEILDDESHLHANNSHVGRVRASIKRRLNNDSVT